MSRRLLLILAGVCGMGRADANPPVGSPGWSARERMADATMGRPRPPPAPNRFLVKYRSTPQPRHDDLVRKRGGRVFRKLAGVNASAIEVDPTELAALRAEPDVALVEPDLERRVMQWETSEIIPTQTNGLYGLLATRAVQAQAAGASGLGIKVG